mmetsp:Transcript_29898/g.85992  ORF Transcript_29898/g.85992 Transcript_29898/m.85992 type:complete len:607 (+) Transcript_29898:65-1885(+)
MEARALPPSTQPSHKKEAAWGKEKGAISYTLSDEDYAEWKRAWRTCRASPECAAASLRRLAARQPRLLNWRSPVTGQALLHELAIRGASRSAMDDAISLGCVRLLPNLRGETIDDIVRQRDVGDAGMPKGRMLKSAPGPARGRKQQGVARDSLRDAMAADLLPSFDKAPLPQSSAERQQLPQQPQQPQPQVAWPNAAASAMASFARSLFTRAASPQEDMAELPMRQGAPEATEKNAPAAPAASQRRSGTKLRSYETLSVPKACMKFNLDVKSGGDIDLREMENSIKSAYAGAQVRVQIDEVADAPLEWGWDAIGSPATGPRSQKIRARVMFDNIEECQAWQARSSSTRFVQDSVAASMNLDETAVDFDADAEVEVDTVDAITLKLDSNSSRILCGACVLCNDRHQCEKVVCFSDRSYANGAIRHSGDDKVDGKSVHTIEVDMSRIPESVSHMYFTICACGCQSLSCFQQPSIMMYSRSSPDENLLEYSIDQAADSLSSVMARLTRRSVRSESDLAVLARTLRKVRMPLLCIDLCFAFAAETTFDIQALGTEQWNLPTRICNSYAPATKLIGRLGPSAGAFSAGASPRTSDTGGGPQAARATTLLSL